MSAADLNAALERKVKTLAQAGSEHTLDTTDVLAVSPALRGHFHGARIQVTRTYENGETWTRRGRIGITTGWKPALLLVSRRGALGSSDLLDARDKLDFVVSE